MFHYFVFAEKISYDIQPDQQFAETHSKLKNSEGMTSIIIFPNWAIFIFLEGVCAATLKRAEDCI